MMKKLTGLPPGDMEGLGPDAPGVDQIDSDIYEWFREDVDNVVVDRSSIIQHIRQRQQLREEMNGLTDNQIWDGIRYIRQRLPAQFESWQDARIWRGFTSNGRFILPNLSSLETRVLHTERKRKKRRKFPDGYDKGNVIGQKRSSDKKKKRARKRTSLEKEEKEDDETEASVEEVSTDRKSHL